MRSFIPWIGGKSQLAKRIISEFPTDFERYIEVFGGGASVLFASDKHAPMEVYNDANGQLVNLFRCLKYHRGELQKEIRYYLNSRRLDRVLIEHKDFEELIKQYDRPNALFYCDPPYHTTEKHYSERFSETDHYRLNTVLKALKGRFILSYNDDDFVRELYKDFDIKAVERQNNLSKGSFKEVIIKNF